MGKRKSITERIASSKIVKAGMSIALALSVCASVPNPLIPLNFRSV